MARRLEVAARLALSKVLCTHAGQEQQQGRF
jgi:hypothetical protein